MSELYELIINALGPFQLIGYTLLFLPGTLLASFTADRNAKSSFQNRWFARFWNWFGPLASRRNGNCVAPLLYQASGTILDIGTGAGNLLALYDKSKVTKIVAVETNREQHPALLKAARDAGLQDRLEVAAVPVEELTRIGLERESFDYVVTLHMFCSASDPEGLATAGYKMLKPGGRWIVFEHVKANSKSSFINWWQGAVNVIWPFFLGGCQLTRDTARTLRNAGKWKEDTLKKRADDSPYSMLPDIEGILVKA